MALDFNQIKTLRIAGQSAKQLAINGNTVWSSEGDNSDAHTLLLLHAEKITDSSSYNRAITNHGVVISDAQSKFGSGSMYFDGNTTRLEIPNLLKGNTPFTIECWVYPLSYKNNTVWSHGGTNTSQGSGGGVELFGDGKLLYYCDGYHIHAGAYSINEWQHIAFIGEQTSVKLYHNGALVGIYNNAYNFAEFIEDIGANASAYTAETFHGYIDEFRISDVARWTEDFEPPNAPYEQ